MSALSGIADGSDAGTGRFMNELTRAQFDLYAYIRSLLGHVQDADDVLQETNAALWSKRAEYDLARPFMPWAKTFAYYQVKAYRQKQMRGRLVFDDEVFDVLSERLSLEQYSVHSALEQVEYCIEKLLPRQQTLLDARYRMGEPLEVLAENMKCSVNAVSVLLCRMRQALLHCLSGKKGVRVP